jgi:monoterpene epsilon-lactone hydrolase
MTFSSISHVVRMWFAATIAAFLATFRRLLLGPTLPSWTWRTEWTIASVRAIIRVAAQYRDDPVLNRFGLIAFTPIPLRLRKKLSVRRTTIGSVQIDRYVPTGERRADRVILYFHGGGYIFGNPGTHRQFIAQLVNATNTAAIAPRYRLAPDNKFPAAVDDAQAAYEAALSVGTSASEIIVAGDSAGAGLALALIHRLRAVGIETPAGAVLFSPYIDLTHSAYTIETNASTDYLPVSTMRQPNDWYAEEGHLADPEASPLYADLNGFPPLLIFAGGAEMLLDDAIRLKDHADRDGVTAELIVEPDMIHVWPAIVEWEPASHRALERTASWVDDQLG